MATPAPKKGMAKKRAPAKRASTRSRRPNPRDPVITTDVLAAVVEEIPPAPVPTNSRSHRFAKVLKDVRELVGPGKPVQIATFASRNGATQVKRKLEAGERPIDGEVEDWEFAARRIGEDEDAGSVLFATLKPRPESR